MQVQDGSFISQQQGLICQAFPSETLLGAARRRDNQDVEKQRQSCCLSNVLSRLGLQRRVSTTRENAFHTGATCTTSCILSLAAPFIATPDLPFVLLAKTGHLLGLLQAFPCAPGSDGVCQKLATQNAEAVQTSAALEPLSLRPHRPRGGCLPKPRRNRQRAGGGRGEGTKVAVGVQQALTAHDVLLLKS